MTGAIGLMVAAWAAMAAPPVKITSEVATPVDLTAEVVALSSSIEQAVETPESFDEQRESLKRKALQIAILAQALAEHEMDSPLKKSAPGLRNAALALARTTTVEEARQTKARLNEALEGKLSGTPAVEAEWGKLTRAGSLMPVLKERSDAIRRALRRPKDPELESRNAMTIAVLILAVHGDTGSAKNAADKSAWQEISLELQGHMSRAAAAIKARDSSTADHFRLGMEACDKCHLKFKP